MISGYRASRFLGERSFESFTPNSIKEGKFSAVTMTPATTNGPITQPRPASSTPAINNFSALLILMDG